MEELGGGLKSGGREKSFFERRKERESFLEKRRGRKSFLEWTRGIIQDFLDSGIDDRGRGEV